MKCVERLVPRKIYDEHPLHVFSTAAKQGEIVWRYDDELTMTPKKIL